MSAKLEQFISDIITTKGNITFAEYMEIALYHPENGYYTRDRLGRGGDFYTSPEIHSIFGELLTVELESMWRALGGGDFLVVEIGGGKGHLCQVILRFAESHNPEFFASINYLFVERPFAITDAEKLLRCNRKVRFLTPKEFSVLRGIEGCILSNELIDAFPVHVVVQREELKEIFVSLEEGFIEVEAYPSTPEIEAYFNRLDVSIEPGTRAEVNLASLAWMKEVSQCLSRGFLLTVDYGCLKDELYLARPEGTLRSFFNHMIEKDPFVRIGEQDITAHVNFSSLIEWGQDFGLKTLGYSTQSRFLLNLGVIEWLEKMEKSDESENRKLARKLAVKHLFMPHAMGEVFKVLIQGKGVDEISLMGFD